MPKPSAEVGGTPARSASGPRLATYVLRWLTAGALTTAAVLVLLQNGDAPRRTPTVALPPVREIVLIDAVRKSRCRLERLPRSSTWRAATARTPPAPPRIYDAPPATHALAAATRRGIIVIQYHPQTPVERVEQLRQLQRTVPQGTILAPGAPAATHALVVSSYRRVLRCARITDAALNALRLFRGRFVGMGPER